MISPLRGGTLVFSVTTGEPANYDCHGSTSISLLHRVAPHYSTLIKISQTRYPEIVGDVAQSWSMDSDGLAYRFTLAPNVRFHDGSQLTATDVKATYERIIRPKAGVVSARQQLYQDIVAIETPDARTIVFRLAKPNAAMLALLASPWNCLYSAARLADDPRFPERNVLGTGPFRFVRHVAGSEWIGERFPDYFRPDRPFLDGFRVINMGQAAATNAIIAGQIHTDFRGLTSQERDRIVAARGAAVASGESGAISFLGLSFNTTRPPLDDARVRRALHIAIDRWKGADGLSRIFNFSDVGGLLRDGSPYAATPEELKRLPGFAVDMAASRAEARRLLTEAGQTDLTLTLTNRNEYAPLGVFLIDQWRQIGVTVKHDLLDNAAYFGALSASAFDLGVDATVDYVDEPTLQFQTVPSYDVNPNNRTRAIDRTVDELYERQLREPDPAARARLVRSLENHLLERAYRVPLFWSRRYVLMARQVRGYDVNNPSNLVGQDLADLWLAAP